MNQITLLILFIVSVIVLSHSVSQLGSLDTIKVSEKEFEIKLNVIPEQSNEDSNDEQNDEVEGTETLSENEENTESSTTINNSIQDESFSKPIQKKSTKQTEKILPLKDNSIFSKLDANNNRVLTYYGLMLAGAVARSAAATAVHPLNVIKTMLQTKGGKMPELRWSVLSRGAGSQFIMSIPHGAINFAVTETTKTQLAKFAAESSLTKLIPHHILNPLEDFISSAISTFICSTVSTPQMVLTDRIMAGFYPNFFKAVLIVAADEGFAGFYTGWCPALVQKIPSYALTWMFFQQVKTAFRTFMGRAGTTLENTLLGSFAAAGACCVMIPVDTVKTRIVTQPIGVRYYDGMWDCLMQIIQKEGVWSLYRALPPRLCSVVPMIGIQFAVYELMKRLLVGLPPPKETLQKQQEQHQHEHEQHPLQDEDKQQERQRPKDASTSTTTSSK